MIWYGLKCSINDPDYRRIEAATVYIALFPTHRIQISEYTKLFLDIRVHKIS